MPQVAYFTCNLELSTPTFHPGAESSCCDSVFRYKFPSLVSAQDRDARAVTCQELKGDYGENMYCPREKPAVYATCGSGAAYDCGLDAAASITCCSSKLNTIISRQWELLNFNCFGFIYCFGMV
jgi:hypothetical protein